MRPSRRASGFTLVELLVALVISAIVIGGALALMTSQQRNLHSTAGDRALQETARIGLEHLSEALRRAGYGVDPALAFDFGPMATARMQAGYNGAAFATTTPDCNGGDTVCRDSTTGPDEIAFLSRDPAFGPHPLLASPTASTLTISGPLNAPLQKGQLLQVLCYTGGMTWAYVTVSRFQAATAANSVTLQITPGDTASTFPNQTASFADACFSQTAILDGTVATFPQVTAVSLDSAAKVFKVDRYRYYVASYDATGAVVAWGTAGARPYLMLDQGLTGADGTPVRNVIVPDVEDLQLAYVFPLAAANQQVGATVGTALAADETGVNVAATAPVYGDDPAGAVKATHHPGNIQAVQVSLVVRPPSPEPSSAGDPVPAAGNRAAVVRNDGYRRLLVQTTVATRNLATTLPVYPYYDPGGAGAQQLNAGGG